uniref:Peptidase S1 domain-containing protein n=1 Tax=Mus spicilegus TaxID=10103 RepID=A0A8C6N259_MUSSI
NALPSTSHHITPTKCESSPRNNAGCGGGAENTRLGQKPDDLQCVFNKLLPIKNCIENHNVKVTDVMLCAGEMSGGKNICKGDSGGPLICDSVLQGITSTGPIPCGKPGVPAMYTNLIKFNSWIKDTMTKNS